MLIVLRCPPTAEAATVAASTRIATTAIPPSVTAFLIRSLLEGLGSTTTIGIPTGGAGRPYAAPQLESRRCGVRFRAAGCGRATSSRLSDETRRALDSSARGDACRPRRCDARLVRKVLAIRAPGRDQG